MNRIIRSAYVVPFALLFGIASCSNQTSNTTNNKSTEAEHHDHNHDHSTHNHQTDHATTETAPQQTNADLKEGQPLATIPPFTFYKVKSGISFQNEDIPQGRKTVFILFDPSCSHCRSEAAALGKNYDKIKTVNLYFVSMNDPALMASFLETFAKELVNKPNIEVLYDRNQEFIQKFHVPKQFPANYVYSKDGQLEAHWDGDKNISEIITAYTK
ncbi:redoxin domain-containing protein [Sphingobacterium sp. SGG-5]|uniref:peroxiredoxin family protein n=1 Tax=Sphingobacterium sp. SGG-5 TaxID=2710881 RepID=UPI0013EA9618|nr:redoxin domain-containing protein [Sphingobacterium sp. SGG-5]NGM61732.1 redoxin domain-containing protein [Sphingobacterium sp. SGG-5]